MALWVPWLRCKARRSPARARRRESYHATGNNREAVAVGLRRTGAIITAASLILVSTFGSLAVARTVVLKEIGLSLAIGVAAASEGGAVSKEEAGMTQERGDRGRETEAAQVAARKEALLARYEPLSAKAKRQQQRAEEAFLAADGQNAFSAQSEAQAVRAVCDANALVESYRGLLIEIRQATELADLVWLDV